MIIAKLTLAIYINDEDLKISIHYEKIRKICDEQVKIAFFLKVGDNDPELLLAYKNQSLRSVLKMKNIDDRNISIFCRDNQVILDEAFEKQNLQSFCLIEINEVF